MLMIVPLGRVFKCGERIQGQLTEKVQKWKALLSYKKKIEQKKERMTGL
jgi:hypothetical protein